MSYNFETQNTFFRQSLSSLYQSTTLWASRITPFSLGISLAEETPIPAVGGSSPMAAAWRSAFPILLVTALIAFEERVSVPSCEIAGGGGREVDQLPEDLKVMMVADLLLLGPDAGFTNVYFRHAFATKFFRLQRMLGPFLGLPLHVVLGDRDVGLCTNINEKFVSHIAGNLPGLDSSGCGIFEISNVSFISLNAVALLCGNNDLRFSVEKVIENESLELLNRAKGLKEAAQNGPLSSFSDFHWRQHGASAGSGPVLLLHFPLHRMTGSTCDNIVLKRNIWHNIPVIHKSSMQMDHRLASAVPYESMRTLPPNVSDYILHALKPSVVFSAHTHRFCDHIHVDGTREITVPTMSWTARDDPGFIVVTIRRNKVVAVNQCSLARESHVVMMYVSVIVLLITTVVVMSSSFLTK